MNLATLKMKSMYFVVGMRSSVFTATNVKMVLDAMVAPEQSDPEIAHVVCVTRNNRFHCSLVSKSNQSQLQ